MKNDYCRAKPKLLANNRNSELLPKIFWQFKSDIDFLGLSISSFQLFIGGLCLPKILAANTISLGWTFPISATEHSSRLLLLPFTTTTLIRYRHDVKWQEWAQSGRLLISFSNWHSFGLWRPIWFSFWQSFGLWNKQIRNADVFAMLFYSLQQDFEQMTADMLYSLYYHYFRLGSTI